MKWSQSHLRHFLSCYLNWVWEVVRLYQLRVRRFLVCHSSLLELSRLNFPYLPYLLPISLAHLASFLISYLPGLFAAVNVLDLLPLKHCHLADSWAKPLSWSEDPALPALSLPPLLALKISFDQGRTSLESWEVNLNFYLVCFWMIMASNLCYHHGD